MRYRYYVTDSERERIMYIAGGVLLAFFLAVVIISVSEGNPKHLQEYLAFGGVFLFLALLFLVPGIIMTVSRKKSEAAVESSVYKSALTKLPAGVHLQTVQSLPQGQNAKKVLSTYNNCYDLLVQYPSREVLEYIHTYNPKAAFELANHLSVILRHISR